MKVCFTSKYSASCLYWVIVNTLNVLIECYYKHFSLPILIYRTWYIEERQEAIRRSLSQKEFLRFIKIYNTILSFISLILGDISVKILLHGIYEIFLPMFSSRTFMVSWLIFKSFTHLEFIFVSAVPLLGYSKDPETPIQKNLCTPMFMAAQFTIAKCWKQPKCPSANQWIKKTATFMQWNCQVKRHFHF